MRDENRSEIIHDALNLLDDDMIEEVERLRGGIVDEQTMQAQPKEQGISNIEEQIPEHRRKIAWRKWSALAASVCILVAGSWIWTAYIAPINDSALEESDDYEQEQLEEMENVSDSVESADGLEGGDRKTDGIGDDAAKPESISEEEVEDLEGSRDAVVIPPMKVDLRKEIEDAEVDMVAFFIYEGRCYVQNEYFEEEADFVGEYVGTATGLIDEWTTQDGYVDYAGSVAGDFYTVEGVDPAFMLCMKYEYGGVETFINNNGITLEKGSDILENRMHLKAQYESVSFLTHEEWDYTFKKPETLQGEYKEVFDKFIDSFNESSFMYSKDTPLQVKREAHTYADENDYHLYFKLDNGLRIHFWLLEDGYVAIHGINSVCVQIDKEIYEELITILEEAS